MRRVGSSSQTALTPKIMKVLDTFDGHLVLLCKRHYKSDKDLSEDIKRLWEIRCGIPAFSMDNHDLSPILNKMYKLIILCMPEKKDYLHEIVHKEMSELSIMPLFKNKSYAEMLIYIYRNQLAWCTVREVITKRSKRVLISLPKPQKRIFKRVLAGKGEYRDYKLLIEKDKR